MRIYHRRTRDGEAVVWVNHCGRLRRLTGDTPARQSAGWIARRVLEDATGATGLPAALVYGFAAWLESRGEGWDLTASDVWAWVETMRGGL